MIFDKNKKVSHSKLGIGQVVADMGDSVVVRFAQKVEVCLKGDIVLMPDVIDCVEEKRVSSTLEVITMMQALSIRSINDQWGVFARSQIELLPHQLWVCRQARQKTPCRLLVADDVGLGKTIEAGIILASFIGAGQCRRILILTPSALVEQWQYRMRTMFDVRLAVYTTEADTPKSGFWETQNMVVASLHTLRFDYNNRQDRLLSAEPWDLVIVDEAHHLNFDEKQGPTLGYTLLQKLSENNLTHSMLFFTGTPHRGKNFNFLALMKLLNPDDFDPKTPLSEQLVYLKNYMIRNNKYNVTDLKGNLLFQEPIVKSATYNYSPEEQNFYDTLTAVISNGMVYANNLNQSSSRLVVLVLITMQKLASSSVAAIRNALKKRLDKRVAAEKRIEELKQVISVLSDNDEDSSLDDKPRLEEELLELSSFIEIVNDESSTLNRLLDLATKVKTETKISSILDVIEKDYSDESILFFTEYKATQAMLMMALMQKYGVDAVTFINGDESLESVTYPDGQVRKVSVRREHASDLFNRGERRFLIATEAAGEGIDLQKRCHILFHVDLPWNPMRLHQRVGRLNRYGQKQKVEVLNFRNPTTVESRIWDKLTEKLNHINQTFSAVMEDTEDMFQLVLGMTPPSIFNDLFSQAPKIMDEQTLSKWFDKKTSMIGQQDVFDAVKAIVGNAARFNFNKVSKILPKVDLPDAIPFFENIMKINQRRLNINEGILEFNTPEEWLSFGVKKKYDNLVFSRMPEDGQVILGVGHIIFEKALQQALSLNAMLAIDVEIQNDLLVFSVRDHLTDQQGEKITKIYGCEIDDSGNEVEVITDWQLLFKLNSLRTTKDIFRLENNLSLLKKIENSKNNALKAIELQIASEEIRPKMPIINLEAVICKNIKDTILSC